MTKKIYLLFCLFIIATAYIANAQSSTLNGVYVGAELYTTPFQGMQINNIVLYFRNDGTFNNALNQADWKTKASGSYTLSNNMENKITSTTTAIEFNPVLTNDDWKTP